jgi:hypothetical protein
MNNDEFTLEMLASPTERGLLNALWKDPYAQAARDAYHDYLCEQERQTTAAAVRDGYTPGWGYIHLWERGVCRKCRANEHNQPWGPSPCTFGGNVGMFQGVQSGAVNWLGSGATFGALPPWVGLQSGFSVQP